MSVLAFHSVISGRPGPAAAPDSTWSGRNGSNIPRSGRRIQTGTEGEARRIAEVLTMAGLVRRTGLSRGTIHFYLRQGVIPPPQKTAINRSLYTEEHVRFLEKIAGLKRQGKPLAEIKAALQPELVEANHDGVDLAELQSEQTRRRILRVATEEFMTHGYRQTLVASIIRKAGVTSQVLYSHFPSKGELLVESFRTFIQWNVAYVEPRLMTSPDLAERVLGRLVADSRANQLGSEVLSLVRAEPANEADLVKLVEQAWDGIVHRITDDLESAADPASPPPVSLELLAYSLIGAHHNAALRATWDDQYSREDVVGVHLWIWLAMLAALTGEVDVNARFDRYRRLIKEAAARPPETPPAPED